MEELFIWAEKQDFYNKDLPESPDVSNIFFGELFRMPAFADLESYSHDGWINETIGGEKFPKQLALPVNRYIPGFSRDHSISHEDIVNVYIPSEWLAKQMELCWNGVEGHFFDVQGNLIAFDPSVRNCGIGTLLIHRESFLNFLNGNGYDILWIMRGEKRILTTSRDNWKGHLKLNGTYRLVDGKIQGMIRSRFYPDT